MRMHDLYCLGGQRRRQPPQVVYAVAGCPHGACTQRLQAIDFRLEADGGPADASRIDAWWDDIGFAGRCPGCGRWVHFTIRGKRAITEAEAAELPKLPDHWED